MILESENNFNSLVFIGASPSLSMTFKKMLLTVLLMSEINSLWVFLLRIVREYLFIKASVPLVLSFLLTGNLVYGFAASSLNYKMLNLAGMLGLHLCKKILH